MLKFSLDQELLASKIKEFRIKHGKGAITELRNVSGVDNLGRIQKQNHGATIESWLRLHLSFPEDFPPPTTTGGGIITYTEPSIEHPLVEPGKPIPGERKLQHLYLAHRSRSLVRQLTLLMQNIDKAVKNECQGASKTKD